MQTDWDKIREILNTVVDTCEQIEYLSADKAKGSQVLLDTTNGITVGDLLISLRMYPENLSHSVISARHELKQSKSYTSDIAHTLINTAKLCTELLEVDDLDTSISLENKETSITKLLDTFTTWHKDYIPTLLTEKL